MPDDRSVLDSEELLRRGLADFTGSVHLALTESDDPRRWLAAALCRLAVLAPTLAAALPPPHSDDEMPHMIALLAIERVEAILVDIVAAGIHRGHIGGGDPLIAARLILGMMMEGPQRHGPAEVDAGHVAEHAIRLLRLTSG